VIGDSYKLMHNAFCALVFFFLRPFTEYNQCDFSHIFKSASNAFLTPFLYSIRSQECFLTFPKGAFYMLYTAYFIRVFARTFRLISHLFPDTPLDLFLGPILLASLPEAFWARLSDAFLQLPNKVATFLLPFYAIQIGHFESCLSICWNHFRNFICLVPETWASRKEEKLYFVSMHLFIIF